MAIATKSYIAFLLISSLLLAPYLSISEATIDDPVPIVSGLSWTFYQSSCPTLEFIVRNYLMSVFSTDIGQAAGLLRLHFHDCFVQGCDASVLLDGSTSGPGEQQAPPNLSLRARAFEIIDELRNRIENACGRVVSCADIVALAARDSVYLENLPPPTANASIILSMLATKNFDPTDVVALSGGHTIGLSHCTSFTGRLYPTQDPTMYQTFANNLKAICPTTNSTNTTVLDIRSPNIFDNKYYVDLMNRKGLFTSDQDLYTNSTTRDIVTSFALNQGLFSEKFAVAMIKMGQLSVLTGNSGEIRTNCSVRNADNKSYLASEVEEARSEF